MLSLRRIAHSTSLRDTGSWMFCWSEVACEARPARACSIACLTVASSPDTAGAGGVSASELAADLLPLPPLPLAVFLSFLLAFLLSFLVSFLASFLDASFFFSLVLVEAAFLSLVAAALVLSLALSLAVDFDFAAEVSACAMVAACSPIPATATSSNAVSSPWTLVNVPVLPSAERLRYR